MIEIGRVGRPQLHGRPMVDGGDRGDPAVGAAFAEGEHQQEHPDRDRGRRRARRGAPRSERLAALAMNSMAPMMASGAMITLIRNDQRHEKSVVSKPPMTGPSPAADPATAPQAAKAMARPRPWNVFDSRASVAGSISEAPSPSMRASPTTRLATFHDSEASSEPAGEQGRRR